MVVTGVYVITAGELTMGGLIACSIISGRALTPIAQISNLVAQWQHARFSLKGLNEILNKPADDHYEHGVPVEPTRCELDLKLEGVEFAYESQTEVLHVPSLRIQAGERVAIIGAVGSGKSTLLKLMAGLYRPLKGRVFLDGVDMAHLRSIFVRRHVHFLPQDARLFNGTLRENLVLGLSQDPGDDALLKAAKATGLDKMMAQHPRGLGLMISEGGHGLSGGQRQVVAITRLMLSGSGILLLDEPTASLDGPLEEQVARSLLELSVASDSVVIVTHKPSLLKYVNRIVVMDRGRVALDGPRDAVLARLSQPPKQDGGPA
jgi:ATP-binding cassette subfamily C protein LapB